MGVLETQVHRATVPLEAEQSDKAAHFLELLQKAVVVETIEIA
jgi:hypothetical protein